MTRRRPDLDTEWTERPGACRSRVDIRALTRANAPEPARVAFTFPS